VDVHRLERQVVQQTMREQLAEARAARRQAEQTEVTRRRLEASRSEVRTGADDDGLWLELEEVEIDWPMHRWLRPWIAAGVATVAVPLGFVVASWVGGSVALLAMLVCTFLAVRQEYPTTARLVVTPRGFWALFVRGRLDRAGRVEDLRVHFGGYHKDSAAHGMTWVALVDTDGRVCESDQLVEAGPQRIRQFAREAGLTVR
jgi:hypothetical protein